MISDPAAPFETPVAARDGAILATSSVIFVPVLHAQDIVTPPGWPDDEPLPEATVEVTVVVNEPVHESEPEFRGTVSCPSRVLVIGDLPDNEREIAVSSEAVVVRVTREPVQFAERVHVHVIDARQDSGDAPVVCQVMPDGSVPGHP